jgi:hypothetical protein
MLFASLIIGILSVTDVQQHKVHVPNKQMMISPLSWFNAVGWSWQMLDCFYWFYSVLPKSQTALCLFSLSKIFFVGAASLPGVTTTIIKIFTRCTYAA